MADETDKLYLSCLEVDITPKGSPFLVGYRRDRPTEAIYNRLTANIQIWFDGKSRNRSIIQLVAAFDTLFLDTAFQDRIAELCNLAPEQVLIVASHTHNAPALFADCQPNMQLSRPYLNDVLGKISHAVLAADTPVEITGIKVGEKTHALSVNRRKHGLHFEPRSRLIKRGVFFGHNHRARRDEKLQTISFMSGEKIISTIWKFAAHAAFFPDQTVVCSDYPGMVRENINGRLGTLLYFPGFAGTSIPTTKLYNIPSRLKGALGFLYPLTPNLGSFTNDQFNAYVEQVATLLTSTVAESVSTVPNARKAQTICRTVPFVFQNGKSEISVQLNMLKVAGVRILATSGEMPAEWLGKLSFSPDVMVTGYAAGRPIYVPTQEMMQQGGYEADGFWDYFQVTGNYVDESDFRLITAVQDLLEQT